MLPLIPDHLVHIDWVDVVRASNGSMQMKAFGLAVTFKAGEARNQLSMSPIGMGERLFAQPTNELDERFAILDFVALHPS
ncbi:hypothetical protein [Sphingomonas jaspsi]|uniref:hypothetical protein n=1 Tax=Sphingomonas jaspsi TaxID=392409 RepID=UPI0012EBC835|nr:hypothetical protein [Sphingomonas jaspsi]